MPWRDRGYDQKLRRCRICDQWDVRMTRAAEYRLLRFAIEHNGRRTDCYAHAHCLERRYGKLWHFMLADRSEADRIEGRAPRSPKRTQTKRQKAAEESSRDFVEPFED